MNQLVRLNTQDRWVLLSMALTLGGLLLGAILGQPRAFGITALIVISLLLVAWRWTPVAPASVIFPRKMPFPGWEAAFLQ